MEAAIPMPAFASVLRELEEGAGVEEAGGGVLGAEGGRVLIEDEDDMEDVEDAEDVENVEDKVMLLVVEVEETDVVELDAPCCVKDSGEGA